MTTHATKKTSASKRLAITSFVLGILALFPPALSVWKALVPSISAAVGAHFGLIPLLVWLYFSLYGSIPSGVACLVTGWLALRRKQRNKEKPGKVWAILGIVFGAVGLIYSVIIVIHLIMVRNTPITPIVPI